MANIFEKNKTYLGDCLELMPQMESGMFDMILCDLPYGTTACEWDILIPLDKLWNEYKRLIKPNGNIILFGSQPFTTDLICSNRKWFKYELIWDKVTGKNIFEAKRKPLKAHENVLVFYEQLGYYQPQMEVAQEKNKRDRIKNYKKATNNTVYGNQKEYVSDKDENLRYPNSIYIHSFQSKELHPTKRLHNTQKPVALFEWLIKSYCKEDGLILDNCAGSGTTAEACYNTGRNYIQIEKERKYFDLILGREKSFNKKDYEQKTLFETQM
jgi:site-specific DNA-methyltransferase (adenine-specific)